MHVHLDLTLGEGEARPLAQTANCGEHRATGCHQNASLTAARHTRPRTSASTPTGRRKIATIPWAAVMCIGLAGRADHLFVPLLLASRLVWRHLDAPRAERAALD